MKPNEMFPNNFNEKWLTEAKINYMLMNNFFIIFWNRFFFWNLFVSYEKTESKFVEKLKVNRLRKNGTLGNSF